MYRTVSLILSGILHHNILFPLPNHYCFADVDEAEEEEEDDEDNMEEIDTENIIYSERRTRGKVIDFAKAAEQAPPAEEDEEDDDDFTPAENMQQ